MRSGVDSGKINESKSEIKSIRERFMMKNLARLSIVLLLSSSLKVTAAYKEAYQHIALQDVEKSTGLSPVQCQAIVNYFYDEESRGRGQWMDSYDVLPRLINAHNLSVGCEVGVSHGFHSYFILKNSNVKKLFSVDPYKHFSNGEYNDGLNIEQKQFDILHAIVRGRLAPFKDRCELMRMTSLEAAQHFTDGQLDFVYIDGNHEYSHVKADLEAWWNKVRSGGIISGDDYNPFATPGVCRAVDEFFAKKGLKVNFDKTVTRFYWVIKP